MNKKALFALFGLALLLGAGCASADKSTSIAGEKNGFVDRRTSEPPEAPENIPPPTEVHPAGDDQMTE